MPNIVVPGKGALQVRDAHTALIRGTFFWKDMTRGLAGPIPISQDAQASPQDHPQDWVDWYIQAASQFIKLHVDAEAADTAAA